MCALQYMNDSGTMLLGKAVIMNGEINYHAAIAGHYSWFCCLSQRHCSQYFLITKVILFICKLTGPNILSLQPIHHYN